MKVLFTADLHINLRQKNVPIQWARDRYQIMFDEFDRVYSEQNCDTIVFGGDIFDKVPNLEELALFVSYIHHLAVYQEDRIIIFDGNHEATRKGKTFMNHLANMLPKSVIVVDWFTCLSAFSDEDGFDILPYCKLHEYEKKGLTPSNPILLTHVRGSIPPHVIPEVDLTMFKDYKVVFAGDLHAHSNSQLNIVYPGSPVTVTYHRNEVKTGVIVFDKEKWDWHEIKTPQLIRKTVSDPAEMIKTDYHHTIYELTGDMIELSSVEDNELLDKKIVDHQSESALDLKNLSEEEELILYCTDILQLPENHTNNILRLFNDYAKNIEME
jgi:DNA repair exonuclease SbcCD nuclease subunit